MSARGAPREIANSLRHNIVAFSLFKFEEREMSLQIDTIIKYNNDDWWTNWFFWQNGSPKVKRVTKNRKVEESFGVDLKQMALQLATSVTKAKLGIDALSGEPI